MALLKYIVYNRTFKSNVLQWSVNEKELLIDVKATDILKAIKKLNPAKKHRLGSSLSDE